MSNQENTDNNKNNNDSVIVVGGGGDDNDDNGKGGPSKITERGLENKAKETPVIEISEASQKEFVEAAHHGAFDTLKHLLSEVDINAKVHHLQFGKQNALTVAVKGGHHDIVTFLVQKGANINIPDDNNWTVLHYAAAKGNEEMVRLFLKNGADVTILNSDGESALIVSQKNSNTDIYHLLLNHVSKNTDGGIEEKGEVEISELLIESNPDLLSSSEDKEKKEKKKNPRSKFIFFMPSCLFGLQVIQTLITVGFAALVAAVIYMFFEMISYFIQNPEQFNYVIFLSVTGALFLGSIFISGIGLTVIAASHMKKVPDTVKKYRYIIGMVLCMISIGARGLCSLGFFTQIMRHPMIMLILFGVTFMTYLNDFFSLACCIVLQFRKKIQSALLIILQSVQLSISLYFAMALMLYYIFGQVLQESPVFIDIYAILAIELVIICLSISTFSMIDIGMSDDNRLYFVGVILCLIQAALRGCCIIGLVTTTTISAVMWKYLLITLLSLGIGIEFVSLLVCLKVLLFRFVGIQITL